MYKGHKIRRVCREHPRWWIVATLAIALAGTLLPQRGSCVIPTTERQALIDLYTATNGGGWTLNTNWCASTCPASGATTFNAVGSECTWYGVSCDDGQTHVTAIGLTGNNLTGTLPALGAFMALRFFAVTSNHLSGTLPSLSGLTQLVEFHADKNQFSGSLPSLSGLVGLGDFTASGNQLGGMLPSLSGLIGLYSFDVADNQLTGSLPSLSGLSALQWFNVDSNQLTGSIPSLTGATGLQVISVTNNRLTGTIPALTGSTNLYHIGLGGNRITGAVPAAPSSLATPLAYWPSTLCANPLTTTPSGNDSGWNAATGSTPWWAMPFATNRCDDIFNNGFEGSP